jgi:hypothetical protein
MPAKIKKKMKTFKNVSDPCMVPKAVESQPRVDCIKSLIGESISIKIYEQNMAKASNTNAVHRAETEFRKLLIVLFFTIINIRFDEQRYNN